MPSLYKALVAVMVVTVLVFFLGRPLLRRFMTDADFTVRRNVWLGLTLSAFLIPNYWAYVLVACVVLAYGVQRDTNPAALYVFLLLAMLPTGKDLPTFGLINRIFPLDHLRLLSLVILVPVALRLVRSSAVPSTYAQPAGPAERCRLQADVLILLYAALQIVLLMPHESITATLRRMVLIGIDMWLPYYVLSRSCRTRESMVEVMAALALAMFVLTPLAVWESSRHWLFYTGLQEQWGTAQIINYLSRGGFVRAQVTAGHSIVLGNAMMIAFGFWLFLQSRVAPVGWRVLALLTLLIGLAMPSARGPWLGAILVMLVFLALGPNRGSRMFKVFGALAVLSVIALVSPYGDQIIERLPFIGTLDESTVTYRQQLASSSWLLIQQNPWFGTPGYLAYMEDLRQGQGIIDMVNAYASIALAYGLVALASVLGFFSLIVVNCIRGVRSLVGVDPDLSLLGASLVACIVGALFMIATVNLYLSVGYLTWSLAGLGVAYVRLVGNQVPESTGQAAAVDAAVASRPAQGFA